MDNNKVYIFFSHLLLDFFGNYHLKNKDKFQLKFQKKEDVQLFYDTLKIQASYGSQVKVENYIYNDYQTYCIVYEKFKLIIACSPNEDFLTGLRNNFFKVHGFETNTAILFIHNTDLESINKGVLNISMKHMPFAYDNIAQNIVDRFSTNNTFTQTQCDFIDILLRSEDNDYHIENTNIFDLAKYLSILVKEKLNKEDFNALKLFYDDQILEGQVPNKELTKRIQKNQKWHSEMTMHESVGSLDSFIEKTFGQENVSKLKNKENWDKYSYDDLLRFEENKGSIKFNEYLECSAFSEEELAIWDIPDGTSTAKLRYRNIIIFNPDHKKELTLNLKFRRKVSPDFLSALAKGNDNSLSIDFKLATGSNIMFKELTYKDVKSNKINKTTYKVLIVPFSENTLNDFKTKYAIQISKDYSYLEISSEDDLLFNPGKEVVDLELNDNTTYDLVEDQSLKLSLTDSNTLDKSKIRFQIKYGAFPLNVTLKLAEVKPLALSGTAAWLKKNQSRKSIFFLKRFKEGNAKPVITLEHGTSNYFPTLDFRNNLLLEEQLIEKEFKIATLNLNNELINSGDNNDSEFDSLYLKIIQYFKNKSSDNTKALPSLTYIDDNLSKLYADYLSCYRAEIKSFKENEALSKSQQDLLKIGTVYKEENSRLYIGPLHPLMLAYQLNLKRSIDEQFLVEPIDSIVRRLSPVNLLPYINNGSGAKDYFIGSEQEHSLEWIEYIDATLEGQSLSRRNVPEMISSKLDEFTKHFTYLFIDNSSPIKINLVNTGDCKESLKGIFNYFSFSVKEKIYEGKNIEDIRPIQINIYGSNQYITAFEHFSKFENEEDINEIFGVNLSKIAGNKVTSADLLNLYHKKIQFSIKNTTDYDYAHITFYQFEEKEIEKSSNNVETISTGINLNGVLTDLPSVNSNGNYRTGFGLKDLNYSNDLIDISQSLNAMAYINNSANIYNSDNAFASVINADIKERLHAIYQSSQWVTFINPRVDLSFFKDNRDVVIIHYADQYGNSTGYDSITVTTKWEQYEFIISEYLKGNVQFVDSNIKHIINMFNAINGYWLLKLGSQTNYVEREKISLLSAFKEAFAILDHPNITWVGLSLEEILRVTGGAGLKQNDPNALFSVKSLQKSGSFSDDLLMVGIEVINDKIQLYFYPIEVKIGNNTSQTVETALQQAKNTYNLLVNTLNKDGFTGKIFRNYLCNLILNSAQKLALYEVWPNYANKWTKLNKLRGKLLNDEFEIGTLEPYIGDAGIISFKNNQGFAKRKIQKVDNCMIIDLYDTDGLNDLVKSVDDLKNRYLNENAVGITAEDLLVNTYQVRNSEEENEVIESVSKIPLAAEDNGYTSQQIDMQQNDKSTPLKIKFGSHANTGEEINWFPTSTDKVMHTNTGIIGTMGTGKTQFTKSLITQLVRNQKNNVDGKPIGILIFDYKGDYIKEDFVEATNAKVYKVNKLPFNPLALSIGNREQFRLPVITANTFLETLVKAFGLGKVQTLQLKRVINDAYENRGIYKDDSSTWNKLAPTLEEVFENYLENSKVKPDSLLAAIDTIYDLQIFEPISEKTKSLYELIEGVAIIDLSGIPPNIQNLVVAITLDQFYSQMQVHGHSVIDGNFRQITKMILVDEADNFLSKDFESVRKILKEGREFGVGTILSTQFLNHFSTDGNDYLPYIATWILHRVSEVKDKEIQSIFKIENKIEKDNLISEIRNLDIHYSLVNRGDNKPIKIKDLAFWELKEKEA